MQGKTLALCVGDPISTVGNDPRLLSRFREDTLLGGVSPKSEKKSSLYLTVFITIISNYIRICVYILIYIYTQRPQLHQEAIFICGTGQHL